MGRVDEVIPLVEKLLRLSPRDPEVSVWNYWIGRVHLLKSRTDEAILWFEKARGANPAFAFIHAYLASAYALNGEAERAAAELAEARRLSADGRYSSITRLKAAQLACRRSETCSRPLISPASARPGCRRRKRRSVSGEAND
jgi:tetratricopeptide (TPR) repeat protein